MHEPVLEAWRRPHIPGAGVWRRGSTLGSPPTCARTAALFDSGSSSTSALGVIDFISFLSDSLINIYFIHFSGVLYVHAFITMSWFVAKWPCSLMALDYVLEKFMQLVHTLKSEQPIKFLRRFPNPAMIHSSIVKSLSPPRSHVQWRGVCRWVSERDHVAYSVTSRHVTPAQRDAVLRLVPSPSPTTRPPAGVIVC